MVDSTQHYFTSSAAVNSSLLISHIVSFKARMSSMQHTHVQRASVHSRHGLDLSVIDEFITGDELLSSSPLMGNQEKKYVYIYVCVYIYIYIYI